MVPFKYTFGKRKWGYEGKGGECEGIGREGKKKRKEAKDKE